MKKRILALSALILSVNALAQDEKFFVELEKTVVSVEKFETNVREASKNVSVITQEEIKKSGAKSLTALLQSVPGIFTSSGFGSGTIDFRGQGEASKNNVLVLVDGISLNTIDMAGPDLSIIDINSIERIEIIPSGGVVYGDKAVGGVINIITNSVGSIAKIERGSYGYENFSIKVNESIGALSINTSFSKTSKEGYRKNSNFTKENAGLALGYDINENNKIRFNYAYNESNMNYAGSLSKSELKNDRTQALYNLYDSFWTFLGRVNNNDITLNEKNQYSLVYSYNKDNLSIENNTGYYTKSSKTTYTDKSIYDIDSSFVSNNFKVKYNNGHNSIITGVDISEGNSKSTTSWGNDKIKKNQLGIFVLDTYKFNENLSGNIGYRNETLKLKYNNLKKEETSKQNLFSTGINYLYSETGSFYSSFEQNYRTPATDEYAYGTSDLKPQLSNTLELGIRDYFGNTYFTGAIFNTLTENEIFYNSVTYTNENIPGKTDRKGLELSAKTYLGDITISQAYIYIGAKIKDGVYKGKKMPWVPENKYSIKTEYDLNNLSLGLEYSYIGSLYSISDWENKYGKVENYSLLNLSSKYKFAKVNVYGGINNLLDKKYNEYVTYGSNYYPAEERNYYLGLSYEF